MLDGTRAWLEATRLAARGAGPAVALSRPAGHHATKHVAMGFGLVNFGAAAVMDQLAASPDARVAILDWDAHHGNGVAEMAANEPRVRLLSHPIASHLIPLHHHPTPIPSHLPQVRYCSLHEAGGFPGTGPDVGGCEGAHSNILHVGLPKGAA
jgi:acetoin utilization deacetylase AcuC-like enzyme